MASAVPTTLVSSHLMGEMALTAEHLIVIGCGRLTACGIFRVIARNIPHAIGATSHGH
jgi:ABC-type multidrug transport system ATPase subunit